MTDARPRVAVSSCLLGELVRYDGKQKRISWIADVLAIEVELVSICPEVGAGMPVPRPPIQIVKDPQLGLRLQVVGDGGDLTSVMQHFVQEQLAALKAAPVDGYIFKARSPSCGLRDVPHFTSADGLAKPSRLAAGLWAASVGDQLATLPLVDESDVQDEAGQKRFLQRVRAHWLARG